jgi:hypothetical protein
MHPERLILRIRSEACTAEPTLYVACSRWLSWESSAKLLVLVLLVLVFERY